MSKLSRAFKVGFLKEAEGNVKQKSLHDLLKDKLPKAPDIDDMPKMPEIPSISDNGWESSKLNLNSNNGPLSNGRNKAGV